MQNFLNFLNEDFEEDDVYILILPKLEEYIDKHSWPYNMIGLIGRVIKIKKRYSGGSYMLDKKDPNSNYIGFYIPRDCAEIVDKDYKSTKREKIKSVVFIMILGVFGF